MFFKKKGLPEVGELVVCTVKRITPHSAFVSLDEYENKEAMLHISEVSTKWVKSITDFISEGKKIVCKVLQKNEEKGYVDVSLKRVSNVEAKRKMDEIKTEIRVEKLIEVIAKKFGQDPKKGLNEIGSKILKQYPSLAEFYTAVREDLSLIDKLDIPEKWASELKEQIAEQLKSQQVLLKRTINVSSVAGDGIIKVKNFLQKLKEIGKGKDVNIEIKYISSPKYLLELKIKDYKSGEAFLKKLFSQAENLAKKSGVEFSVVGE